MTHPLYGTPVDFAAAAIEPVTDAHGQVSGVVDLMTGEQIAGNDVGYLVEEVGRRRRGRRFGRALGAIFTGGMSEVARAAVQRRARTIAASQAPAPVQAAVPAAPVPALMAPAPATQAGAQMLAAQAAQQQLLAAQQAALGFSPSSHLSGPFGFPIVTVAPGGVIVNSVGKAQEPTQIHRLVFEALDPAGVVPPGDALRYIRITSIQVGAQTIFSNTEGIGAGTFANDSVGVRIGTRLVTPGIDVTVGLQNRNLATPFEVQISGLGPT